MFNYYYYLGNNTYTNEGADIINTIIAEQENSTFTVGGTTYTPKGSRP